MSDLNQADLRAAAELLKRYGTNAGNAKIPADVWESYCAAYQQLADYGLARLDADAKQAEEDARPVDTEEVARELGFQGPEGSTLWLLGGTLTWSMCDTKTRRKPVLWVRDHSVYNPTVVRVRKLLEALEGE